LHLHFDKNNVSPSEYSHIELIGSCFYETSTIKNFLLSDKKVLLHVRRRSCVDQSGKSYSCNWDLVAKWTRYSNELATF
jgi:hypothetical protein